MIEHPTFFCPPKQTVDNLPNRYAKNSRMREMNHNAYGYFFTFLPNTPEHALPSNQF